MQFLCLFCFAAVFVQTKDEHEQYTLRNCAIKGNLVVDLSTEADGIYNVTIREVMLHQIIKIQGKHIVLSLQIPQAADPSKFKPLGSTVHIKTPKMTLYLTVNNSILKATSNDSNAKMFDFPYAYSDTAVCNSCIPPSASLDNGI